MPELALMSIDNAVATLTLNRPEARNALSPELIEAMNVAAEALARDAAAGRVRVMILTGAGQAFCAARLGQVFGTRDGGRTWQEWRLPEGVQDVYAIACG